ncbi:MAG: hypothetical protein ACOVMP_00780 [Chthoniobacterales bacterium]
MVELLIFLALIGWGVVSFIEFLSSLAAFPTLVAGVVAVPVLAAMSYERLLSANRLEFIKTPRKFLPPERFYWPSQAKRALREILALAAIAGTTWSLAIIFPARLALDPESIAGWICGLVGIVSLAGMISRAWMFVVASQRFDRLTPWAIGSVRRFMFWISDNHEFLGEEPEVPKKPTKESVY